MLLNKNLLTEEEFLNTNNFKTPHFDVENVKKETIEEPTWLHNGGGNIFRSFLGSAQQNLLNNQFTNKGIIATVGNTYEKADIMKEYDNLTINVILKNSGDIDYEVIGSIVDYLKMDTNSEDFHKITKIFKAPSLQMVSFTITEKGYNITKSNGDYTEIVLKDFKNGPENVESYMGKIVSLLHARYLAGKHPIALVSMDNISKNGDKLRHSIIPFAQKWEEEGLVDSGFLKYLTDKDFVTYPLTMIDKITPGPDQKVQNQLEEIGFTNMAPKATNRGSTVAPFVNGEETEYLIIEDNFPNGRPNLEESGIIFTDRETVNLSEIMKVTAALNPLHTALAIFGCLLGYKMIHEEMQDEDLLMLVKQLGYKEGLPTVVDPEIISPKKFIDEVIKVRFPNPFIPDTPQRIATDTSQKLSIRYGHTIKSHIDAGNDVSNLVAIPLVYAGWLRYLIGIDDQGNKMELSSDPLLSEVQPVFEDIGLGSNVSDSKEKEIKELLKREDIFGINLMEYSIGHTVIDLFKQMIKETGAVRNTLNTTLKDIQIK